MKETTPAAMPPCFDKLRHFILVFCAYTFILWHKLTGGLRRRWANKEITTFPEAMARISYSNILSFYRMA